MDLLLDLVWRDLLNPEFYIRNGGLWLFLFIVFAETGLFAGFFLPGDSLLFVAGIYSNVLAREVVDTNTDLGNLLLLTALVVAAGMDAALPTVLGGLVGSVIVGVPTSVGYGVAERGTSALHSMLASCAPGITVVNIDNGYGAACAALRVLRAMR